ncbi:MAG: hypothetical protein Q4D04_13415 [Clostridia bacterium]|nr:hypothetical protein [Clostridia bacterium]
MRFLFEYALEKACNGNKSEFARRLGIEYTEVQRVLRRFRDGAGSINATEAVLEMYWRDNISIDDALDIFTQTHPGLKEEATKSFCDDLIGVLRTALEHDRHSAQDTYRVFRAAEAFMRQMELIFCSANCRRKRDCETQCPCKHFAEYVKWLKREMLSEIDAK